MRIRADIIEPLETYAKKLRKIDVEDMTEEEMDLQVATYKAARVLKHINKFAEKHGEIALSCAGEWLYQDDRGSVDAIDLVADLLEELSEYAETEEE
ncbi:hypothetical protein SDC9_46801 [bioreactor metagenome]|uniref:Uncharacterized protein n=1 Tax=bioreactor metagenome TaxID=1076179 RepID=A0A644WE24_9ZZZZ